MKIVDRYIFREIAIYFLICLVAFTGILFTLRMIQFASLIINRGVGFSQIGLVFLAIIPTFLELAIPLATLLGVMLAMGRLSGDSEIIVMRASGISMFSLVRPVLLFGALACLFNFAVSLYLGPWGFQSLQQSLFDIARSRSLAGLEHGVFNKIGSLTLYANEIDYQTGALRGVLIDDRRNSDSARLITAEGGQMESDQAARSITLRLRKGQIHELAQGRYVLTDYESNNLVMDSSQMYDSGTASKGRVPREMYLTEIHTLLATHGENLARLRRGEPAMIPEGSAAVPALSDAELVKKLGRLRTEAVRRFSMPFASLIMALMALPLGIQVPRMQRTWGAGLSACLAMLVFVTYYALLSIGITLSENETIPTNVGLWIPNLAALVFAVYATRQMGFERWQSVPNAIEQAFSRIAALRYRRSVA